MMLSEYLSDRDVVVRLNGKQIFTLVEFKALRQTGASKVLCMTAQGTKFQEVAHSVLAEDGDFDMKDRIALKTQIGLLTVASAPGRNARSIMRSSPEAARPWPYRPGY